MIFIIIIINELAVTVNAILQLQQSFHSYVMNISKCSGSDVYLLIWCLDCAHTYETIMLCTLQKCSAPQSERSAVMLTYNETQP